MFPSLPGGVFTAQRYEKLYALIRDKDILPIIEEGNADVGFVGSDTYGERITALEYDPISLAIGKFVLAAANKKLKEPIRVVTSYPIALAKFALERALDIKAIQRTGSLEAMIALGVGGAIFDIKVSGATLKDNNLTVIEEGDEVTVGIVYNEA